MFAFSLHNEYYLKYIESRTTQYMVKRNHIMGGKGIILHPRMSHAEPTTLYAFYFCLWPIPLFGGFIHNSLLVIDSKLQLHERTLILFIAIFSSSLHLNSEIGYLTNWLYIDHFKCENKCFSKFLLSLVEFHFLTAVSEMKEHS